jgi:hypothetical protein
MDGLLRGDGVNRRSLTLPLVLVPASVAVVIAGAWPHHGSASADEARVAETILEPGQIVLVVVNDSREAVRVRQVILSNAFVQFRQTRPSLTPGDTEQITITYPWVEGEAYDIELLTATGATIAHQLEDASPGVQAA